jgi:acetylglutamate kinase
MIDPISNIVSELPSPPLGAGGGILYVIKIGGNIIDDENKLSTFLKQFAELESPLQGPGVKKILVHGGGKMATKLAGQLGIQQDLREGRRITDAETLKIVTMVYAGYINKNIVAQLQAHHCNAIGLCGADGNAIEAHKRAHPTIDYGFVGDVDAVNTTLFKNLLAQDMTIVFAPITHNKEGQLLNTNADTIAQEIAKGLSKDFEVTLVYSFEKNGVLANADDDGSVISKIDPASYKTLKEKQVIFGGMIPKLDNAFAALNSGVSKVVIGNAQHLKQLISGQSGTTISNT